MATHNCRLAVPDDVTAVGPLKFPFPTPDPFLFCVYHKDAYPPGDGKMQAPRKGNGHDFDPTAPYRMYHGDRIPGFPRHPHRGFETITATIDGLIDHADSLGNAGRYGQGDLQWMTAAKGICHAEMFPLLNTDGPNPARFFQIWLNLPARSKMKDPNFRMHWAEDIPKDVSQDGLVTVTVWAGEFNGKKGLPPPPDSWASDPNSAVAVWAVELKQSGRTTLPPAPEGTNRALYFIEGSRLECAGRTFTDHAHLTLRPHVATELSNPTESTVLCLILQGRPIGEPVASHGPFVMNTDREIQQAFTDYHRTQFGGWPWPEDAMVFPAGKGRFALQDGEETTP